MTRKSPITNRWYTVDSLSEKDRLRLFPDFDEKAILEELKSVPSSVKKNHVVSKKDVNVEAQKVVIGSPSLKQNKKKSKK